MREHRRRGAAFLLASSALCAAPSLCAAPALAQEHPSALEEIVVTAQRREENLDKVPISVASLSAAKTEALGIVNFSQLSSAVPGLTIERSSIAVLPALRGLGSTGAIAGDESVTAVYIDGVYLLAAQSNTFDLPNVDRVEVIKGPQGTLFGRNAVGGVVQIVTKTPTHEPHYKISALYGDHNTAGGDAYFTGALATNLDADITLHARRQYDGWGRNETTGTSTFTNYNIAATTKVVWNVSDRTDLSVFALYSRDKGQLGVGVHLAPGALGADGHSRAPAGGFWNLNGNVDPKADSVNAMGDIALTHDFGWASLVNRLAYQKSITHQVYDFDASPSLLQSQFLRSFAEGYTDELQLLSPGGSKISWIVGAFYMDADAGYSPGTILGPTTNPPPLRPFFQIRDKLNTRSFAAYGQVTAPITQKLRLTLGARWTRDERKFNGANYTAAGTPFNGVIFTDSHTWSEPSGRVSLDYDVSTKLLAYVSYNRGFKSGAYNTSSPGAPPVNPTTIDAYEAGLKGSLSDRRLRFDASVFDYDVSGIQLRARNPATNLVALINAAEGKIYGVDLNAEAAMTERLTISTGAEFLNTRYSSFPAAAFTFPNPSGGNSQVIASAAGNRLAHAPVFTGNLSATYRQPSEVGPFEGTVSYSYMTHTVFDPDNRLKSPAHGLLSASLRWARSEDARWDIRIWGTNLTNSKYYLIMSGGAGSAGGDIVGPAAPRQFGVTISVKD